MKAIFKSKKRLFAAVLVFALVVALAAYLCNRAFFVSSTAVDVEDLWPENGPVIATIDGREYRYDPVYLYRLTGCVFDDDPYAVAQEYGGTHVWDIESPNPLVGFGNDDATDGYILSWDYYWRDSENCIENPVTGFSGVTMAENAVRLEIMYWEQADKPIDKDVKPEFIKDGREATMKSADEYLHKKYRGLSKEKAREQAMCDLGPGDEVGYNDANLAYCVMMNKAKFKEGQSVNSYLRQAEPYIEKHAMIASYSFPDVDDFSPRPTFDELMEKYNVEMVY